MHQHNENGFVGCNAYIHSKTLRSISQMNQHIQDANAHIRKLS